MNHQRDPTVRDWAWSEKSMDATHRNGYYSKTPHTAVQQSRSHN